MSDLTVSPPRTRRELSARQLVGGAVLLSTGVALAFQAVGALVSDDPGRAEGPYDSLVSIAVVGVVAMALALGIAAALRSRPGAAAIVLGTLSVLTVPVFWSGAPAVFGSVAAWRAGLVRDATPTTGAPRGFGVVGLVIVVLEIVVLIALNIMGFVQDYG